MSEPPFQEVRENRELCYDLAQGRGLCRSGMMTVYAAQWRKAAELAGITIDEILKAALPSDMSPGRGRAGTAQMKGRAADGAEKPVKRAERLAASDPDLGTACSAGRNIARLMSGATVTCVILPRTWPQSAPAALGTLWSGRWGRPLWKDAARSVPALPDATAERKLAIGNRKADLAARRAC